MNSNIKDNYGIAFHKLVAVYDYLDVYNTSSNKMVEIVNPKFRFWKIHSIVNEHVFPLQGLYCFGGKKETGQCTNELKVLKISSKYYSW